MFLFGLTTYIKYGSREKPTKIWPLAHEEKLWLFLGSNQYWAARVYVFVLSLGAHKVSNGSVSAIKHPRDGAMAWSLIQQSGGARDQTDL